MNIGRWEDVNDDSGHNLIENNVLFNGGHHVIEISSSYNVIRNNHFYNLQWMDCQRTETGNKCGNRIIGLGAGTTNAVGNIIEGNRITFSGVPPDQTSSAGISMRSTHNIVRRNFFYANDGPGLDISTYSSHTSDGRYNHVYHNVFFHNGYPAMPNEPDREKSGMMLARHGGLAVTDVSIKNNIFHNNQLYGLFFYYVTRENQVVEGNWEEMGDPLFVDGTIPAIPVDSRKPDFTLQRQSPCVDRGVFLTKTVSAGAGTKIPVEDIGYFTDGLGIIESDKVQLEGQTETAKIMAVDQNNNLLTIDRALTWTSNQGISLAYQGASPDIGAIERLSSSAPLSAPRNLRVQ